VRLPLRRSIVLSGVTYRYPAADTPALRELSLTIPALTVCGLVGKTGAGKTTAIDVILGLLQPQSGTLAVDGTLITEENAHHWLAAVGYVPQTIFLADASVTANIAFGVEPGKVDMAAVERAARAANLHDFVVEELPDKYGTNIGDRGVRLSGGQRQRVGIARALYRDPDLIVMDEGTSALDNLTERSVMEAIQNMAQRRTVILVAHRLSTVRNCNTIFLLDHGHLVSTGTYEELMSADDGFRAMVSAAERA
jgi:ABC-type multidrug transport system fused ATPase/permease subunit